MPRYRLVESRVPTLERSDGPTQYLVPTPRCEVCFTPIEQRFARSTGRCYHCKNKPVFESSIVSRVYAATIYVPSTDYPFPHNDEILRLKNHGAFADEYAEVLVRVADGEGAKLTDYDVVVPIPRRQDVNASKGSGPLAKAIAQQLAVRYSPALTWSRATRSQKTLDRLDRFDNVADALTCKVSMPRARVLLVDDVCTTGATLAEGARALAKAGAIGAIGLVAGRDCDLASLLHVGAVELDEV